MQDKTINNVLLKLRREGGCVRTHAEAILRKRGVAMSDLRHYPPDRFQSREFRRLIREALRDGPRTGPEIVAHIAPHAPSVAPDRLQNRVSSALTRMKHKGMVAREGRVWRLAELVESNL